MRKFAISLAGLWALAIAAPAHADFTVPPNEPGQYAPRNECTGVAGYTAFRAGLSAAVKARDADALARLASETIGLDFGGGSGRDELLRRLKGEQAGELWGALDDIMRLGCAAYDDDMLVMPWFFGQDFADLDPFETWLVNGEHIPLRHADDPGSRVVAYLSWQLVMVRGDYDPEEPRQIVALFGPQGIDGFIATEHLRSQLDYRLVLERESGGWRIAAFVAGD